MQAETGAELDAPNALHPLQSLRRRILKKSCLGATIPIDDYQA